MTEKRARRTFCEEQKKQLVELFNHGKPRGEIVREYDLNEMENDLLRSFLQAAGRM